jgi:hypothetical protein
MSSSARRQEEQGQKEKLLWIAASLVVAAILLFFLLQSCSERPADPVAENPNGKQIPVFPRRSEAAALAQYEADRNK